MAVVQVSGMIIGILLTHYTKNFQFSCCLLLDLPCKSRLLNAKRIDSAQWKWPVGRRINSELRKLMLATPEYFLPLPEHEDHQISCTANASDIFTVKSVMEKLKESGPKVQWYNMVWGNGNIPRFPSILWLLCKHRLKTKDRLKQWGDSVDSDQCVLCNQDAASIDHLLFICSHSSYLAKSAANVPYSGAYAWDEELPISIK
ncbi:uncharacterized protein LOC113767418 [Coffea eugenioides]|uniref:Reverse transcriptase zinc-binding domain-containing protein n=1 Tax=Coffea arabica TaxID=13443 RepID=A0A6P6SGI8_COFAR|nr:uncharacterized protein LOC113691334 [Coffea arabica]XP_027167313.1 uncharacterized protein LOC113767418 [Coffea eugenioides]